MIDVEIINNQTEKLISEENNQLIELVIQTVAELEEVIDGEVVVTLVDEQAIHELNLQYRGIDRPTDVLSFAMNEQDEEELDFIFDDEDDMDVPNMLGDIIISIPRVISQAEDYGHSFERELGFLTVHGFLHLIGYDHNTEDEEKIMFGKQEVVLEKIKLFR